MNRHDQLYKVRQEPRTTWRGYVFAIAWALAMAYMLASAI